MKIALQIFYLYILSQVYNEVSLKEFNIVWFTCISFYDSLRLVINLNKRKLCLKASNQLGFLLVYCILQSKHLFNYLQCPQLPWSSAEPSGCSVSSWSCCCCCCCCFLGFLVPYLTGLLTPSCSCWLSAGMSIKPTNKIHVLEHFHRTVVLVVFPPGYRNIIVLVHFLHCHNSYLAFS